VQGSISFKDCKLTIPALVGAPLAIVVVNTEAGVEDRVVDHRMLEAVAAVQAETGVVGLAAGQHLNLGLFVQRGGCAGYGRLTG